MKTPTQPPATGQAAHTPTPIDHFLPLTCAAWDCHDVERLTEIRTALGFTLSQFSAFFSDKDELAKVREVEALHAFIVRACNSHAELRRRITELEQLGGMILAENALLTRKLSELHRSHDTRQALLLRLCAESPGLKEHYEAQIKEYNL